MLLRHSGVVEEVGQIRVVVRPILAPVICYVKCDRVRSRILHSAHASAITTQESLGCIYKMRTGRCSVKGYPAVYLIGYATH